MYNFDINLDGSNFLEEFTNKVKKSLFIYVPIIFGLLGIVVFINSLSTPAGEKGYLVGAFVGTVLIINLFIIRGLRLSSIIKHTITRITITDETGSFVCAQGLSRTNYNFECTLDNIRITQELNPKKVFKDEKIFVFKLDGKDKLYFPPSLWDNHEDIIQLLKPKNE
jgi:hypothetical protein